MKIVGYGIIDKNTFLPMSGVIYKKEYKANSVLNKKIGAITRLLQKYPNSPSVLKLKVKLEELNQYKVVPISVFESDF